MDDRSTFNGLLRSLSRSTIFAPWHITPTVIWRSERTISHAFGLNASLCPVTHHIWTANDAIWRNHSKPLCLWDEFFLSLDK